MDITEELVEGFAKDTGRVKKIREAEEQLSEFLERYPYDKKPELIQKLTPERLYTPGAEDYFFLWIEFKTKKLGAIFTYGGKVYPEAVKKIDVFKELLFITVDEGKSISEKLDAGWERIKGFGGDQLIAKKILFCYFKDQLIPVFKTEHLEHFCRHFNLAYTKESLEKYDKNYKELSVGEKYQLLQELLLEYKQHGFSGRFSSWSNSLFARFLYEKVAVPPPTPSRTQGPLYSFGLLYEPSSEQEVVFLFSKYHEELGFPYILTFQERFPDVVALDINKEVKRIEIEVYASEFRTHGHDPSGCDLIVCWDSDIYEPGEDYPEVIALKEYLEDQSIQNE